MLRSSKRATEANGRNPSEFQPDSRGRYASHGDSSDEVPINVGRIDLAGAAVGTGKKWRSDATGRGSGPESGGSPAVSLGMAGPRHV